MASELGVTLFHVLGKPRGTHCCRVLIIFHLGIFLFFCFCCINGVNKLSPPLISWLIPTPCNHIGNRFSGLCFPSSYRNLTMTKLPLICNFWSSKVDIYYDVLASFCSHHCRVSVISFIEIKLLLMTVIFIFVTFTYIQLKVYVVSTGNASTKLIWVPRVRSQVEISLPDVIFWECSTLYVTFFSHVLASWVKPLAPFDLHSY